ncbi:MAG: nucleotide exchange factor GrpE [Clostridia bacterium]|nr:nucleotide exchange factor GrpE [Clostridia bacterium]
MNKDSSFAEETVNEETANTNSKTDEAQTDDTLVNEETAVEEGKEVNEEAETSDEKKTDSKLKRGLKKKEKKDKKDEKIEELTDQVKRQMAEFDNFRKRSEKEKNTMYEIGAKSVVEKLLPIVDNFERGLQALPEEEKTAPFAEGMQMIYKQMMTMFDQIGVTTIEAVGTEFNPDYHNAVMQIESDEYESGYVAQELQKGYMYRDSVVRHSMVGVVQ